MRIALTVAVVVGVAAASGGCASHSDSPYDPCASRACGEACTVCAPGAHDCVETAELKACSDDGRCVSAPVLCGLAAPCADKACGAECVFDPACRHSEPPCEMPSYVGHCSAEGLCEPPGTPATCGPMTACEGKSFGDACDPCAPAGCMSPVAYVCDRTQSCVPSLPGCTYEGKTYPLGARFSASDGCNECSCFDVGMSLCTMMMCF